ncbi:MAG: large conductance mechanosensitive channel protein MscL [Bacilli bacterium]|nr:large conductance mechanosensitive channel protein MscL [Bacilli bacterium]
MKSFFSDFKKFITRGNVLDMAVGVIVGGAFTAIVTALNKSILTPFIGYLFGTKDLKSLYYPLPGAEALEGQVDAYGNQLYSSAIYYGEFIQAVIDFLMIALLLFTIVKIFQWIRKASEKAAEKLKKKEEPVVESEPVVEEPVEPKPTTEELLTEIRDLLAAKNNQETK